MENTSLMGNEFVDMEPKVDNEEKKFHDLLKNFDLEIKFILFLKAGKNKLLKNIPDLSEIHSNQHSRLRQISKML